MILGKHGQPGVSYFAAALGPETQEISALFATNAKKVYEV